jgi:hypothetical protein
MNTKQTLIRQREEVLSKMAALTTMEPGALSEQMLPVRHKGAKKPVLRGPYYVLSRWENGRSKSRRVKKNELDQVRGDVANYQSFKVLCEQFVELTRQQGELAREEAASEEAVKKGLKSRSKKTLKSNASSK